MTTTPVTGTIYSPSEMIATVGKNVQIKSSIFRSVSQIISEVDVLVALTIHMSGNSRMLATAGIIKGVGSTVASDSGLAAVIWTGIDRDNTEATIASTSAVDATVEIAE